MTKFLGGVLIFSAAFFVLILEHRQSREKETTLRAWIVLLEKMCSSIRWKNTPLTNLLGEFELTQIAAKELKRKKPLQIAWHDMVKEIDDISLRQALLHVDFSGDKTHLLGSLQCAEEALREIDKERQQERRQEEKIRMAALFSAAGLLVILLI